LRSKGKKFLTLWISIIVIVAVVGIYFTFTYMLKPSTVTNNNNSILALRVNNDDNYVYVVYLQPTQRLADIYRLSPYYYILKTHRYLLEDNDPYIAVKKLKDYGIIDKNSPLFILDVNKDFLIKKFGNGDTDSLILKLLNYFQHNSDVPVISYFSFKSFYNSLLNSTVKKVDKKLQPDLANFYNFLKLSSSMHIAFKTLPTLTKSPIEVGEFVKDGNLNSMHLQEKWYLNFK
jgi:hypothetical protein